MIYSIIIPTYNNLEDCLKPCVESIIKYTEGIGEYVEIIVVANGCTDGTEEFVRALDNKGIKLLSYPDPLGYTRAINTGLVVATGKYVVLLNNDTQILDFGTNWLDILHEPFDSGHKVGITGPSKLFSKEANEYFMIFFCVMIPRKLFFEIGYLDETFNPGGMEDVDFCMRLERAGCKQVRVPDDGDDWSYATKFPIYHAGEKTMHNPDLMSDWKNKFQKRLKIIKDRTDRSYYSDYADVTCEISTKGRYTTTLPMAIMSVIQQELKPKKLLIFQDDFNANDMNDQANNIGTMPVFRYLFAMLDSAGIQWTVVFGEGMGQVRNHQRALELSDTEWVWRMDDDNYAESNVLRLLMEETAEGVAAVAPSVVDPMNKQSGSWSTKLTHINTHSNLQWLGKGQPSVVNAEHLYSTFIYRRSAGLVHGYDQALSVVGHREETIFTYNMFRDGHALLINREAVVWHMRQDVGGIRSYNDPSLWLRDEMRFDALCAEWGVTPLKRLHVNLDGGRGDHYMFRMALPDIRKAHPNEIITVYAAYPECLDDEVDIEIKSVADGISSVHNFELLGLYRWCMERRWDKSVVEAYKQIYK